MMPNEPLTQVQHPSNMDGSEAEANEIKLSLLDVSLFDTIPSQTNVNERRGLLALQKAVGEKLGSYVYLEIGSHLGGSIQPHLVDARCRKIFSIDNRPVQQPDDRGVPCDYPDNSTARMLDLLRRIDAAQIGKITC